MVVLLGACRWGHAGEMPDEFGSDKNPVGFRYGPVDLHPRLTSSVTYDDNIEFMSTNAERDVKWVAHPSFQIVGGDESDLVSFHNVGYDVLKLSPGDLIIKPVEAWPGKLFILDYGPRFQVFKKYSRDDSIDELVNFNGLYPLSKIIVGVQQGYDLEKTTIIEAGQRTQSENISTKVSAAYHLSDQTSFESGWQRFAVSYDAANLTGYTEYGTEDWMNYALQENLHGSLGVLAGWDDVGNHQDQTFEQVRARVRYNYTEKVNFDVSAGGELREYQNGHSAALDPVFSLAGKYLPSERTTVALIGYRQQVASIYNGYYYADTGANLSLQQEIVYICTLDISMGYHVLNYTPINNQTSQYTDSFYDAKVGVEFHIIKHLSGQMFYQMIQRTSAVNGNVTENQVELSLTCRY